MTPSVRTVQDLFLGCADDPAICFATVNAATQRISESLTRADLLNGAMAVAADLRDRGLEKGDRVMLIGSPTTSWVQTYAGIVLAGGVAVPASHLVAQRELTGLLGVSSPRFIVHDASVAPLVAESCTQVERPPVRCPVGERVSGSVDRGAVVPVGPDDPVTILHTSGTTGRPKGVVKTHGEYARFAPWWAGVAMADDDRAANFLPMYHQSGLVVTLMGAIARKIPTFHVDRYRADSFWPTVDAHGLTWAVMMQPMPRQLLSAPPTSADREHALRWAFGTAGIEDWVRFQERFGVDFHSSYGSTETTIAYMTGTRLQGRVAADRIRGPHGGVLCGAPMDRWSEIRIAPDPDRGDAAGVGFIEVSGDAVFRSYVDDPERTAEAFTPDGWFRSGDYGYIVDSGDLYLLDRIGDLIRRNGENISPREIEDVILAHPAVTDCAVVGVADDERGQEVAAFVQVAAASDLAPEDIFSHCSSLLSRHKVPRYLDLVESFPRTNTHKVLKAQLVLSAEAIDRTSIV